MTNGIERRLQRVEGWRGVSNDVARMSPSQRQAEIIRLHAALVRMGEASPPPKRLWHMTEDEWSGFVGTEIVRIRRAVAGEGLGDAE